MAVLNTTHLYNHLPNDCGLCPGDLFTGSMVPWHYLNELHMWDVLFISLTLSYRQANSFLNGNLNLDVAIFLALATFIQVRFPLCTTCKPAVSLPNITLLLTIFSPLSMQLQRKNNHLSIGRCQVLKIQCILLLRFQNLCFHNISTKMLQITLKVQEPG